MISVGFKHQPKINMQVTPISQLFILPNETPVALASGMISNISPHKVGAGQFGQWSFQHADLNDGQTQIRVVFKDRPAIPQSLNGQQVYVSSTNGTGVKVKDDLNRKNNTMQRVLWVTGTAVIEGQDEAAPGQQPVAPQYAQPQQRPGQPAQYNQAPRPVRQQPKTQRFVPQLKAQAPQRRDLARVQNDGPKTETGKMGTMYALALRAAILAVKRARVDEPEFELAPEFVKDIATTIFIKAPGVSLIGVPSIFTMDIPEPTLPTPEPTQEVVQNSEAVEVSPTEDAPW